MKVVFMLSMLMLTIGIKGNIWDNILLEKPDYEFPNNGKMTISKNNVNYLSIIYSEIYNSFKIQLLSSIKQLISISDVIGDLLSGDKSKEEEKNAVLLSTVLDFNTTVVSFEYKDKCDYIEKILTPSLSTTTLIKSFDFFTYGNSTSSSLILDDLGVSVKSNNINSNLDFLIKEPINKLKELKDNYSFALNTYALLSGKQWINDLLNINLDDLNKVDYFKNELAKYSILFTIDEKSSFIKSISIKNKISSEIIGEFDVLFESLGSDQSHSLLNLKNYKTDCTKIENDEAYFINLVKSIIS